MAEPVHYFAPDALVQFGTEVFKAYRLPAEDAATVARDLVAADLRGLASHGVARIPIYCKRLRAGAINPTPNIAITHPTAVVAAIDGDDGIGFVVGHRAMAEAIEIAAQFGIGMVGIRRSTHYGMAALYVMQAIDAGMVSMAFTNSSPAMPAWGGRTNFHGAAPLAVGAPGGRPGDYVLDLAMTVIARGKIRLAASRGEPIPLGLALDNEGRPTTDAQAAFEGVLLPFGGVKGSAIAFMMDIFSGVLTGAAFGGEVKSLYFDFSGPQNVGHLFIAIRPDLFMPMQAYRDRMDEMIERAKAAPRAADCDEILIPGEPESRTAAARARSGIPVTGDVARALIDEGAQAKVALPASAARPFDAGA
ncbi:MAG: Ldh family oxidoreductase [Proteobacteria bacterium]|nr:Ldh family oxidoreductase [Burkholderiales bacterium]